MFGWTPEELGPPGAAADRVEAMLADPTCSSIGTVCVHSDTPGAPALLRAVSERLRRLGCDLRTPTTAASAPRT